MANSKLTGTARIALETRLAALPQVLAKLDKAWRLKRMSDGDLLKLGRLHGLDVAAILNAAVRVDPRTKVERRKPSAEARPLPGAFRGTIEFSLRLNLLGHDVERPARIRWGYTPEWPRFVGGRRPDASGSEELTLALDVLEELSPEDLVLGADGGLRPPLQRRRWVEANALLGLGVLPDAVMEAVEREIDREAREQDQTRRAFSEEAKGFLPVKHGLP